MNSEKTAYTPCEEDRICKTEMRRSLFGADYVIQAKLYLNASNEYFIAYQVQQIYEYQLSDETDLEFFDEGFRQISESEANYYLNKYFDPIASSWRLHDVLNEIKNPRTKNTAYRISHRKPSRKRKYIVSHIAGSGI